MKKAVKYVVVFIIPIICMIAHMIIKGCYPFGDNTILIGDAGCQYNVFIETLIERIKSGGSLFFSWDGGMGYDLYTNFCYYMASPFNIIAVLIGMWNLEIAVVSVMIIQTALCGVSMMYYLTHTRVNRLGEIPCREALYVALSLAYSMSGYMLNYLYNFIWLISLILAPIVMLGVERLIHDNRIGLYYVAMILVFITNFYFAWFICILAVIWFVDQSKGGIKRFIRDALRFAMVSVLSALSAAVVLVPCYMAVLGRRDTGLRISQEVIGTFGSFANYIQSFFWAHYVDKSTKTAQFYPELGYCGIFVVVLCLAYLLCKSVNRTQKLKRIAEIVIISLCLNWYWGTFVFHGFGFPHLLFGRFEFILIILLVVTAKDMISLIGSIEKTHGVIITVFWFTMMLLGVLFSSNTQNLICYLGSIIISVYLGICLILYDIKSIKKISLIINLVVVALFELVSNFFLGNVNTYCLSMEGSIGSQSWEDDYDNIEVGVGERKTAYVNSLSYRRYSDTDIFASSINLDLLHMFDDLGLTYRLNLGSFEYKGTTPLTAAMFNVRYVLTDTPLYYGGYDIVPEKEIYIPAYDRISQLFMCENKYMVGIGYAVPTEVLSWDMSGSPFDVQNSFTRDVLGVGEIFESFSIDSVELSSDTCTIYDVQDLNCSYQNIQREEYGDIQYSLIVPDNMDMYMYIEDEACFFTEITVDDRKISGGSDYSVPAELIHIGNVTAGQKVHIKISNYTKYGQCGTTNIYFFKYHDDIMNSCLEMMSQSVLKVQGKNDTRIHGTIKVPEECVLFTSIPYYKGWTVYVDGKKQNLYRLGGVCGVYLDKGEHDITFSYCTYGFKTGLIMSLVGVLLSIYLFWLRRRENKNEKTNY